MELCLGTVQFGMDYGIRNQKQPSIEESLKCIDYAVGQGITAIDTARAYGEAEEILGEYLKLNRNKRDKLHISTKFIPNLLDDYSPDMYETVIENELKKQLKILNTEYVDAYLFHSARYAFDNAKIEALSKMKEKGLVKKIGVSVYEPEEAKECLNNRLVEFIQLPYSIFDHRMKEQGVFETASKSECVIHSRSAFIQGLIAMKSNEVPDFLKEAKPILDKIDIICKREGISSIQLALAYVKKENRISNLVFGVDNFEQLKSDIELFNKDVDIDLLNNVEKEFGGIKAEIVMPSLWKK